MEIRFTKKADGNHMLTVIRDDGSVTRDYLVPGMSPAGESAIPHDLVHVIVENELGLSRGVYGLINTGKSIQAMMAMGKRINNKNEPELLRSEYLTATFQQLHLGLEIPLPDIPREASKKIQDEIKRYNEEWKLLPNDSTLSVPFSF
jgi:hypothetical protein